MPINIDADLTNADWTKTTWDMIPLDSYLAALEEASLGELRRLRRLPAYQAAPRQVVEIVERRLA